MKLSRPALLSAFLCPGLGQWAAGYRVLGAAIVMLTVSDVLAPFARMFVAVAFPPPCDPFKNGIGGCMLQTVGAGWHVTWPLIILCVPLFGLLWGFAVWHANGLTLPEK